MVCQCTLNLFGYSALAFVTYRILMVFYRILFPYFLGTPVDLHKKAGAKWAVVTGATDGIGKAYAKQLAKKGFNVLLVSRTQSKLDDTKKEILEEAKNIEVRTFAFDFSKTQLEDYQPLLDELKKTEVGVLVNNVGQSFEYPEIMHRMEGAPKTLAEMTSINTLPVVLLSSTVVEQMTERRAGIIVNIASFAGYYELAEWSVYSASKRFVLHLSSILDQEYGPRGITVQAIAPMLVATKMSKVRRESFFAPFADRFVKSALRTIGLIGDTSGYFSHQIQVEVVNLLPEFLVRKIIGVQSSGMRAGALKKKAKEAKE